MSAGSVRRAMPDIAIYLKVSGSIASIAAAVGKRWSVFDRVVRVRDMEETFIDKFCFLAGVEEERVLYLDTDTYVVSGLREAFDLLEPVRCGLRPCAVPLRGRISTGRSAVATGTGGISGTELRSHFLPEQRQGPPVIPDLQRDARRVGVRRGAHTGPTRAPLCTVEEPDLVQRAASRIQCQAVLPGISVRRGEDFAFAGLAIYGRSRGSLTRVWSRVSFSRRNSSNKRRRYGQAVVKSRKFPQSRELKPVRRSEWQQRRRVPSR